MRTENPLESLAITVATDSRDWGQNKRDAWIYGIVCGWSNNDDPDAPGEDAMGELARRFSWSDEDVARLKRLRATYIQQEALLYNA